MELDQLFYSYPDQTDIDIQNILSAKREFSELATGPLSSLPATGGLFNYQLQGVRFMNQYDRMLGILEAGTGKTCYGIGAAEVFREHVLPEVASYITDYIMPTKTNIKRVYIITMNPTLIREMKQQIICSCTGGRYYTETIKNAASGREQRQAATREVKKYYSIYSVGSFYKELLGEQNPVEKYSDTLFIFDEVHNIRNSSPGQIDSMTADDVENAYNRIHDLFHTIQRSKIMLFTATPIVDNYREFVPTMNLILPLDNQMSYNADYLNWNTDQFAKYFNGYIAYVRALPYGIDIEYVGDNIQSEEMRDNDGKVMLRPDGIPRTHQTKTFNSQMSKYQSDVYRIAAADKDSVYLSARLAATFVFPNGSPRDPVGAYIQEYNGRKYLTEEFSSLIRKTGVAHFAAKIDTVIKILTNERRKSFVYYEFVAGAGIDALAALLNTLVFPTENGGQISYEQFDSDVPVVINKAKTQRPIYCVGASTTETEITIQKAPRFAVIEGTVSSNVISNILQLFNSYENRYGEYLQFVIGSGETKTGINFTNVTDIHIVSPPWNNASTYQAYSRAIRATSHLALKNETGKNVTVRIFQHAAILDSDENNWTIDMDIYSTAEKKDIKNRQIIRQMKILAWDCPLNINRNVVTNSEDYSPECDYLKCQYKCYRHDAPKDISRDQSQSYDVLYADEVIDEIATWIIQWLQNYSSISYDDILQQFPDNYNYIIRAAKKLDGSAILSIDGVIKYIVNYVDIIYAQDVLPALQQTLPSEGIYVSGLSGSIRLALDSVVDTTPIIDVKLWLEQLNKSLKKLEDDDKQVEAFNQFSKLSFPERLQIIEYIIPTVLSPGFDNTDKIAEELLFLRYDYYIVQIPDPTPRINMDRRIAATQRIFQRAGTITVPDEEELPLKTVHTYYINENKETAHKFGIELRSGPDTLRVYEENGWRTVTREELPYYREAITNQINENYKQIFDQDLYAYLISDKNNMLYIVDKSEKKDTDERRGSQRVLGKNCSTFQVVDLYRQLWRLGHRIEAPDEDYPLDDVVEKLSNLNIININFNPVTDLTEELKYYYLLSSMNYSKAALCALLFELFNYLDLLIMA